MENETPPQEEKADVKKMERQAITLIVILLLVLASFIAAYLILKPKPYFMYGAMKVYPLRYGESNILIYSFPLTLNMQGESYEAEILMKNSPSIVENISYNVNESLFNMAKIAFTMDPQMNSRAFLAAKEISGMAEKLNIPTVFGVSKEAENPDLLVFDCQNSTDMLRIVNFELANETKVFSNESCIIVQGENYDEMMEASDKLVLEWLKLITK